MATFGLVIPFTLLLTTGAVAQEFPSDPDHLTSLIQVEALDDSSLGAADASPPRLLLPLALDMIKDYEKWASKPYNDASRYCTIGYGHLVARQPCEAVLTTLQRYDNPMALVTGLKLLETDSATARRAVQQHVKTELSDQQFGALTSFVFNVGANNFARSTLLKYVNNQELEGATREFGRWVLSNGVALQGLVSRRSCEAALFAGKVAYRRDGKFYREDCGGLGAAPEVENLIDVAKGE